MSSIWKRPISLASLQKRIENTLCSTLGIVFTKIEDRSLSATMPVDERTIQPLGMLHGGATCALIETVGSAAANYCLADETSIAVGLDINVNHMRAVAAPSLVEAIATPWHLGRTTQVWEIRVLEKERTIAIGRLTMAIVLGEAKKAMY